MVEDYETVWANRPAMPVRDTPITVMVVGKRCVYMNDRRVAGGKPYVSEQLTSHNLTTTLGDILDAFSDADIKKALKERQARNRYFNDYHTRVKAAEEKIDD